MMHRRPLSLVTRRPFENMAREEAVGNTAVDARTPAMGAGATTGGAAGFPRLPPIGGGGTVFPKVVASSSATCEAVPESQAPDMSSSAKPLRSASKRKGVDLELSLRGNGGNATSPIVEVNTPVMPSAEGKGADLSFLRNDFELRCRTDERLILLTVPIVDLVSGDLGTSQNVVSSGHLAIDPHLEAGPRVEIRVTPPGEGTRVGGTEARHEGLFQGGMQTPPPGGATGDILPDFNSGFSALDPLDSGEMPSFGASFLSGAPLQANNAFFTMGQGQGGYIASASGIPHNPPPETTGLADLLGRLARLEGEVVGMQTRQTIPPVILNMPLSPASGFETLVLLTRLGYVLPEAFSDPVVAFLLGERVEYLRALASEAIRR